MPEQAKGRATITQKAPGVVFGLDVGDETFRALDPEIVVERLAAEGEWRERRSGACSSRAPPARS